MNAVHRYSPILIAVLLTLLAGRATGGQISKSTTDVFNFQKTLAERGTSLAQYKLAAMYELGIGVDTDLSEAVHWYAESLQNGIVAAEDRLVYLDILQQGYKQNSHADWLAKIRAAAKTRDQDAMLLLGQLYSHGKGVTRDLEQARRLLSGIDMIENPIVAYEIERVDAELAREKAASRQQDEQAARQRLQQQAREQAQAQQQAELARMAEAQEAEKRRRYEEVMRKLAEEQRILEQTQAWAEGEADELPQTAIAVK